MSFRSGIQAILSLTAAALLALSSEPTIPGASPRSASADAAPTGIPASRGGAAERIGVEARAKLGGPPVDIRSLSDGSRLTEPSVLTTQEASTRERRLQLYDELAPTLKQSYWLERGNEELGRYAEHWRSDVGDPLTFLQDAAAEAAGAAYYGDAAEAVRQLVSTTAAIRYWQIGKLENWALAEAQTLASGPFQPAEELETIRETVAKDNPEEALLRVEGLIPKLKRWREQLDEAGSKLGSSGPARPELDAATRGKAHTLNEPEAGLTRTVSLRLEGLPRDVPGVDVQLRVALDTWASLSRGAYEIRLENPRFNEMLASYEWDADAPTSWFQSEWSETVHVRDFSRHRELKAVFEVHESSNVEATFEARVVGEVDVEWTTPEEPTVFEEMSERFDATLNQQALKGAGHHLDVVLGFLEAEQHRLAAQSTGASETALPVGQRIRITGQDAKPLNASISGSRIVWPDQRTADQETELGTPDIFLYDLSTDTQRRITDNDRWKRRVDISGDLVVWEADREIILYDLSTGARTQVTDSPGTQTNPAIDGDHLVWTSYNDGKFSIQFYDIATGQKKRLSRPSTKPARPTPQAYVQDRPAVPSISGDRIVWKSMVDQSFHIYVYDITSSTKTRIYTSESEPRFPQISDDRVAWGESRDGSYKTVVYHLLRGTEAQLDSGALISGQRLISTESGPGEDQYLVSYNIEMNTSERILTGMNDANLQDFKGRRVLWTEGNTVYLFLLP